MRLRATTARSTLLTSGAICGSSRRTRCSTFRDYWTRATRERWCKALSRQCNSAHLLRRVKHHPVASVAVSGLAAMAAKHIWHQHQARGRLLDLDRGSVGMGRTLPAMPSVVGLGAGGDR